MIPYPGYPGGLGGILCAFPGFDGIVLGNHAFHWKRAVNLKQSVKACSNDKSALIFHLQKSHSFLHLQLDVLLTLFSGLFFRGLVVLLISRPSAFARGVQRIASLAGAFAKLYLNGHFNL